MCRKAASIHLTSIFVGRLSIPLFVLGLIYLLVNFAFVRGQTDPTVTSIYPNLIQGRVTTVDGGEPGAVAVELKALAGFYTQTVLIDSTGLYTLTNVPPGYYRLYFKPPVGSRYAPQYFKNHRWESDANLIIMISETQHMGVDAQLTIGGAVSGTVTSEQSGEPLAGVKVSLGKYVDFPPVTTDALGQFQLVGFWEGFYNVCFEPEKNTAYVGECYNNWHDGDPDESINWLSVKAGQEITNIDAALTLGGQISGYVTSAQTGQPLAGVKVEASADQRNYHKIVYSDATGSYTVPVLLPGDYRLHFSLYNQSSQYHPYIPEYYLDKPDRTEADKLQVTAGVAVTSVNVALQPSSVISGQVTDADSGALLSADMIVYDQSGKITRRNVYMYQGHYLVDDLPAGTYYVFVSANGYRPSYYDNQPTFESATPLTLTTGQVLNNINVTLHRDIEPVEIVTAKDLPNVLLAHPQGTRSFWFSLDGSVHWQRFPVTPWSEEDRRGSQIALALRDDLAVPVRFLIGKDGLHRSGDYGQSWTQYLAPVVSPCTDNPIQSITSLLTSPVDPRRLYMELECYYYTPPADLLNLYLQYTSTDGGVTWKPIKVPFTHSIVDVPRLVHAVLSPVLPQRLYINNGFIPTDWYQSDDAAQTWVSQKFTVTTLALDWVDAATLYGIAETPDNPRTRFLGRRSVDGGTTWVDWAQQPCPSSFRQLITLSAKGLMLMRCNQGLFRTVNGGDTWQQLTSEPGEKLSPDNGNLQRLFWSRNGLLWASTDLGSTWTRLTDWSDIGLPLIAR